MSRCDRDDQDPNLPPLDLPSRSPVQAGSKIPSSSGSAVTRTRTVAARPCRRDRGRAGWNVPSRRARDTGSVASVGFGAGGISGRAAANRQSQLRRARAAGPGAEPSGRRRSPIAAPAAAPDQCRRDARRSRLRAMIAVLDQLDGHGGALRRPQAKRGLLRHVGVNWPQEMDGQRSGMGRCRRRWLSPSSSRRRVIGSGSP
jgi:hypothetical protein